ncbi:MAG: chemotaxis protein CheW [Symploca sp. SIO3C6]|uniref:Chemotaxis protein CheW n=1 Tax=Symploca sp. SIO1C4 TaxID=2607765 RepID=A0A6B3N2F3_9CYAN|nr:chemotaxis protein CheW [Symploca sp. SIO3C6]NER27876.1 chemotaxis protein CheW [Symploca sp. SIO1C4]NET07566.1 chemotaxis protein CheW [Symploca sp. SIO2B6]
MNLVKSQIGSIKQSRPQEPQPSLPLIVFKVGKLHLAVRIESIYKIAEYPPAHGSEFNQFGVTNVGEHQVTVLDLYGQILGSSQISEHSPAEYLVIVRNRQDELYGIAVIDTPQLMEVPLSRIRVLPESYRRNDTLGIASHVAVIKHQTETLTIFVLDVELLLPT